jgi:poly(3-hydroxybutyrate) depolymerase
MGESGAAGEGGFEQTIQESWASRALEFGMHAGTEAPSSQEERSEFSAAADDERIALFLPDGSAAAVRELWIQAGARSTRISIDPLFGEVRRIDSSAKVTRSGSVDRSRDADSQPQRSAP